MYIILKCFFVLYLMILATNTNMYIISPHMISISCYSTIHCTLEKAMAPEEQLAEKGNDVCPSKRECCAVCPPKRKGICPSKMESCLSPKRGMLFVPPKGNAVCPPKRECCLSLKKGQVFVPGKGDAVCLSVYMLLKKRE